MDQSPAAMMTVVVRSGNGQSLELARPLREIVERLDHEQALADVKTMRQVVDDSSARWRVSTLLFLGFGTIAFILALIGLYSVTTHYVAQRTHEIALRLALGDSRTGIVWRILRPLSRIAWQGVGAGLILALMIARALSTLLYGIPPIDPMTFASAALGFTTVVLVTGAGAAFRMSNVEPMTGLNAD
jgi:putative ABC transport system permease protein